jgi:hypothetical protein
MRRKWSLASAFPLASSSKWSVARNELLFPLIVTSTTPKQDPLLQLFNAHVEVSNSNAIRTPRRDAPQRISRSMGCPCLLTGLPMIFCVPFQFLHPSNHKVSKFSEAWSCHNRWWECHLSHLGSHAYTCSQSLKCFTGNHHYN